MVCVAPITQEGMCGSYCTGGYVLVPRLEDDIQTNTQKSLLKFSPKDFNLSRRRVVFEITGTKYLTRRPEPRSFWKDI